MIKFEGYSQIDWNQISPKMGIIIGGMDGSTVRNISVGNATLNAGNLPEKTNNGSIFNPYHYPRMYIGSAGNGAVGIAYNSVINNTNWSPSY